MPVADGDKKENWLPDLDSNQEIRLQRPLCYQLHYRAVLSRVRRDRTVIQDAQVRIAPRASTYSAQIVHEFFARMFSPISHSETTQTPSHRYHSSGSLLRRRHAWPP